jgi:N-acyl-D-amino-acid deacylase
LDLRPAKGLELIDKTRSEGFSVTADMYPYVAVSSYLVALLPKWATEGGVPGLLGCFSEGNVRKSSQP